MILIPLILSEIRTSLPHAFSLPHSVGKVNSYPTECGNETQLFHWRKSIDKIYFFDFGAVLDKILYITRGLKHITGNACDYK
jgi:energy-converting hydrogenase Eha subunit F